MLPSSDPGRRQRLLLMFVGTVHAGWADTGYSGKRYPSWHTGYSMTGTLYRDLVGQARAVESLEAAACRPVHAYLFVGPPGTGKAAAATSFAASLLCPATSATPPGPADLAANRTPCARVSVDQNRLVTPLGASRRPQYLDRCFFSRDSVISWGICLNCDHRTNEEMKKITAGRGWAGVSEYFGVYGFRSEG